MSHQSQAMEYPGSHQIPSKTMLQGNFKPDKCYCGMKPVKYTCRKQGLNYLRQFYRCPQEPNSQKQCHFFPVDSGEQERGIRKAVCYFTQQSEAASHKQEVRQALRRRIVLMRRARGNFPESYPPTNSRQYQGIYVSSTSTSGVPSSMEQTGHQCAHQDENLHTMWTSGDYPAQDGRDHSALGQSQLTQEVRTTSCSEPLTLKAGQRKHVLGEIQKAIDHLEQNTN